MTAAAQTENTGPAWLRWGAATLLAAYVALSAYVLWRSAVLAVFSDEFDWVNSVYGVRGDHRWLSYLLAPHNLNRLVWTRLLVLFDFTVLHGTNWPMVASGALGLGVVAATLALLAARAAPRPLKLPLGALTAMLALLAGNVLDASTPIYATYAHAAAFAVVALVLSEGARESPFGARGAAALVCAMAAAFGSGAGLGLWPVMAWGALRRRDWRWLALVVAAGAVFVGLYFRGQGHGTAGAALPAHPDVKSALIMTGGYITLPWTRLALGFAWIVGWLIAAACAVLVLAKGGRDAAPVQRIACGLILFTLATAAMAGLGRSGLEEPHNVPIRYGLLVAPLHAGLIILAAPWLGGLFRRRPQAVGGAMLAALAVVLAQDLVFSAKVIAASDQIRATLADFQAGRRTSQMGVIYPNLDYAETMSQWMARDGLYQRDLPTRPPPPGTTAR